MIRLRCKPGTVFDAFSPALLHILAALDAVAAARLPGVPEALTITAGSNGAHAVGSAHYRAEAVDVRTKDCTTSEAKHALADAVRQQLGGDFFVDLEHEGESNEHLHVQLRRGRRFDGPVPGAGAGAGADQP
ncbi:MAG: hypothetical protein IT181_13240 [Acidobacteria bacterium]|nr:hypothetical protein [Acidobacteriota bacterium]